MHILADFGGVDVDVNDLGLLGDLVRRGHSAVADTRTAENDEICLAHRAVRVAPAV